LCGSSKVLLVCNLSPEAASCPETLSSLNFASRAAQVELGQARRVAAAAATTGTSSSSSSSLGAMGDPQIAIGGEGTGSLRNTGIYNALVGGGGPRSSSGGRNDGSSAGGRSSGASGVTSPEKRAVWGTLGRPGSRLAADRPGPSGSPVPSSPTRGIVSSAKPARH
jgi:hypothetical protein